MVEYTVVGIRPYEFDGKDGKPVKGISVYCIAQGDEHVTGQVTDKMSLSREALNKMNWSPAVGDVFIPFYNKYAKVGAVQLKDKAK